MWAQEANMFAARDKQATLEFIGGGIQNKRGFHYDTRSSGLLCSVPVLKDELRHQLLVQS